MKIVILCHARSLRNHSDDRLVFEGVRYYGFLLSLLISTIRPISMSTGTNNSGKRLTTPELEAQGVYPAPSLADRMTRNVR